MNVDPDSALIGSTQLETALKKIYILLPVLILSLACATLIPAGSITDPAQPINVQPGDTFKIIIRSNPSTGYHWEILGELDETGIQFISRDFRSDQLLPILVGAGGVDIWTFKAVTAGQVQLTLGSYPPSAESEPVDTVSFDIIVK